MMMQRIWPDVRRKCVLRLLGLDQGRERRELYCINGGTAGGTTGSCRVLAARDRNQAVRPPVRAQPRSLHKGRERRHLLLHQRHCRHHQVVHVQDVMRATVVPTAGLQMPVLPQQLQQDGSDGTFYCIAAEPSAAPQGVHMHRLHRGYEGSSCQR